MRYLRALSEADGFSLFYMGKLIMRARYISLIAIIALSIPASAHADIGASADITPTATPGGPDAYEYDLTLHNTGDTAINTFWYAWDDSGLNFMNQYPDNVSAPYGWYPNVTYGYDPNTFDYTYGIEWYNYYGSPVAAGQDMSGFSFDSNETPQELAGLSDIDPSFPVGTSFVYMNYPPQQEGDNGFQFVVSPETVPEPTSICLLLAAGAAGIVSLRMKRVSVAR
jgi:hypothetical protein